LRKIVCQQKGNKSMQSLNLSDNDTVEEEEEEEEEEEICE